MSLELRRIGGVIGAEIPGVDLARDLPAETIAAIRQALLDHLVVFFPGQDLTSAQYRTFATRIGTPIEYPFVPGLDGFPEITPVLKLPEQKVAFGGNWHSDTTYFAEPPMATMLLARELPAHGGDTMFANQYLAYETLSDGMKSILSGLRGVSRSDKAEASRTREDRAGSAGRNREIMIAEHPAVRTHPETGRKALYVNIAHTAYFAGMTEDESLPILRFLWQHQTRPEFTCRFAWSPGALALWDNRCAQHHAINDYDGQKRLMHRITLAGDVPR
ncbi:MAG: taurine dioxygenase [Acetobacteraceae bacterium]|nr:taurine dioxygenase [Acetobacteraceae bacterium]